MNIPGPTLPDLMVLEVLAQGAVALMVEVPVWNLVWNFVVEALPEYVAGESLAEAEEGTFAFPFLLLALPLKLSFLVTLTILTISNSSLESEESEDQSKVSSSSELVSMVITSGSAGGFRLGPCAMSE